MVSYGTRRHFFTDWRYTRSGEGRDSEVGGEKVLSVTKTLNRKGDGSCFLPGIPRKGEEIRFPGRWFCRRGSLRQAPHRRLRRDIHGNGGPRRLPRGHHHKRRRGAFFSGTPLQIEKKVLDRVPPYISGKPGIFARRFAVGSAPPHGKACGASPLTPRFARFCCRHPLRRQSHRSLLTHAAVARALPVISVISPLRK